MDVAPLKHNEKRGWKTKLEPYLNLRLLYNVCGLSFLGVAVLVGLLNFVSISICGSFFGYENNHFVAVTELGIMVYAGIYLAILIIKYIHKVTQK
jgi:hypothetical protein